ISTALHLGADRVLVVGTSQPHAHSEPPRLRGNLYPSVAQIAGHALHSIFLDSLHVDIELVQRINRTISLIAPEKLREARLPPRGAGVFGSPTINLRYSPSWPCAHEPASRSVRIPEKPLGSDGPAAGGADGPYAHPG